MSSTLLKLLNVIVCRANLFLFLMISAVVIYQHPQIFEFVYVSDFLHSDLDDHLSIVILCAHM